MTDIPTYPTDRASIVRRGLINLRGQVKSTRTYLETMQSLLAKYEQGPPYEQEQVPGFKRRIANLEDALLVMSVYIELGEQELRCLKAQPTLFESEVPA